MIPRQAHVQVIVLTLIIVDITVLFLGTASVSCGDM